MKGTLKITTEGATKVWPQWLAAMTILLLSMLVGIIGGWTSPFVAKLTRGGEVITITTDQASWIVSLINMTRVFGAIIAAVIVRKFGARKAVLLNGIPHALGWACFLIETSVPSIYTARILSGFGLGMFFSTFPLYIGEISNPSIRGALISFISQGLPMGTLLGNIMGAYTNMVNFALICLVICAAFFFSFIFFPESPHHLVIENKMEEAEKSLRWYNRREDVTAELESLKSFVGSQRKLSFTETLKELSLPLNRKIFMIIISLYVFMQLSGLYTLSLYMETILTDLKVEAIKPSLLVVTVGLIGLVSGLVAMYTNDRFGRRIMLTTSCFGVSVSLFLLGLSSWLVKQNYDSSKLQWLAIVTVISYQFFMNMGIVPVPSCLMSEMFPPQLKDIGACMSNVISATFAFSVAKSYQPMVNVLSEPFVFWFYSLLMLSMFIFTILLLPETKGKSLQEIQDMLMKKPKSDESRESGENDFSFEKKDEISFK